MTEYEKVIKDYYHEYYNKKDKEGKKMLTSSVNILLESVPPKLMAMALVAFISGNKEMFDVKELNLNNKDEN